MHVAKISSPLKLFHNLNPSCILRNNNRIKRVLMIKNAHYIQTAICTIVNGYKSYARTAFKLVDKLSLP
jgi:hypothetical protein